MGRGRRVCGARAGLDMSTQLKLLLVFALVTIGVYAPHLRDGFVYQDANYSFTVAPVVVHSLSLLLHLLNGLLLYYIVTCADVPGAGWIAGVFLIHPSNVEAVAYGAAQSELIILGCGLLLVWTMQRRLWLACLLPLLALSFTKVRGWPYLLTNDALAQGITFATWWRWEALAWWGHLGRWFVPMGFSIDHDVVHASVWLGALAVSALLLLPGLLIVLSNDGVVLGAGLWLALVLVPRFLLRVPLSVLNEHHVYGATPALSVLTVYGLTRLLARA